MQSDHLHTAMRIGKWTNERLCNYINATRSQKLSIDYIRQVTSGNEKPSLPLAEEIRHIIRSDSAISVLFPLLNSTDGLELPRSAPRQGSNKQARLKGSSVPIDTQSPSGEIQ